MSAASVSDGHLSSPIVEWTGEWSGVLWYNRVIRSFVVTVTTWILLSRTPNVGRVPCALCVRQ